MKKKKALIIGGSILVLGVGAFFLFRFLKRRKERKALEEMASTTYDGGGSSSSSSSSSSTSSFDPKPYADRLYKSMKGWGTNTKDFWAVSNALNSSQKTAVKDDFNNRYGRTKSGDLKQWIKDDFSFGAEKKALASWGY